MTARSSNPRDGTGATARDAESNCICMYTPAADGGHPRYAQELLTALARHPSEAYCYELISSAELLAMQKDEASVEARAGPAVRSPAGAPFTSMYWQVPRPVPKHPAVRCGFPAVSGQNTPPPAVSNAWPVLSGVRSTLNGARVTLLSGQSYEVSSEVVVLQVPPEFEPESQVLPVHVGQG